MTEMEKLHGSVNFKKGENADVDYTNFIDAKTPS